LFIKVVAAVIESDKAVVTTGVVLSFLHDEKEILAIIIIANNK
jgi:hypothetical protein